MKNIIIFFIQAGCAVPTPAALLLVVTVCLPEVTAEEPAYSPAQLRAIAFILCSSRKTVRPFDMRNQRCPFNSEFNTRVSEAKQTWGGSSQLSAGAAPHSSPFTRHRCLHTRPGQAGGRVGQIQTGKTKDKLVPRSCSLRGAPPDWCIMAGQAMTPAPREPLQAPSQSRPSPPWRSLVLSFRFNEYFDLWRTAGEPLWLLKEFGNLGYPHLKNVLCFKHPGAPGYASEMPMWEQFIAQRR